MTVERDWFWFWFYYALWLASVFTLVLVLRQSSENRSIGEIKTENARFYALIQIDLRCFDQNTLSFKNSFNYKERFVSVKSFPIKDLPVSIALG